MHSELEEIGREMQINILQQTTGESEEDLMQASYCCRCSLIGCCPVPPPPGLDRKQDLQQIILGKAESEGTLLYFKNKYILVRNKLDF